MTRIIILTVSLCLSANSAFAAISFTDGKWESTFDCAEQDQDDSATFDCDDIGWWGDDWYFDSHRTTILSGANNPNGGGGRGAEFWKGSGADHMITGTMRITFPSAQPELWVRWYSKWESGFEWNGYIDEKSLYFKGGSYSNPYVGFYEANQFQAYTGENGLPAEDLLQSASGGWGTVHPGGTSDGSWHCYEVYMKMDTNGTNGVGRLWVDGVLIESKTDVNWSANSGKPHPGWTAFDFLENQKDPGLARPYYVHVDDITVYNTTPPGRDAQSNPYIGPISGGTDTTAPTTTISTTDPSSISSDSLTVTGTASDAVGVSGCKWRLGSAPTSGAGTSCTGTTSFSCSTSGYSSGATSMYVGCYDAAGNYGSDSITVNYTPPGSGVIPGSVLFSESFEDNSWASRSWYDIGSETGSTAGGYSGNGLRWVWTTSAESPTNFVSLRNTFTSRSELMVEYWVKYETGWEGTHETYHPHMVHILSTQDAAYQSLGATYNSLYVEAVADTTSPYTIRPRIAGQDLYRVNTSNGTPPNNLVATTETRSAYQCNTPYTLTGATSGDCFSAGGGNYYSANIWDAASATIPINTWTRVRAYFKRNTFTGSVANFDGVVRVWIGDTLAIEDTAMMFAANAYATTAWDKIALAPYMGDGSPKGQTMWIDELKIYDGYTEGSSGGARLGSGGATFRSGGGSFR